MARRAEYLGPERRRPLVLDAALGIFAEGGFTDASMSAIAERAGVSKAVLYDCFPGGKQEIYYAMLDRADQGFSDRMLEVLGRTNKMPLGQALYVALTSFFEYALEDPLGFKIMFGEAGTADAEIARRTQRTKQILVEKMGERTRQIMEEAGIGITPVANIYNHAIIAVAEELARWAIREPSLDRDILVRAVVRWWMKGFENIIPGDGWARAAP